MYRGHREEQIFLEIPAAKYEIIGVPAEIQDVPLATEPDNEDIATKFE